MGKSAVERLSGEFVDVVDLPDGDDGVGAELAGDDERLILVIADDADAGVAEKFADLIVEFGAELGIGDVVDAACDAVFRIADGEASAFGSEMRVIIRTVEDVADAVMIRDDAEKAAHRIAPEKKMLPSGCGREGRFRKPRSIMYRAESPNATAGRRFYQDFLTETIVSGRTARFSCRAPAGGMLRWNFSFPFIIFIKLIMEN